MSDTAISLQNVGKMYKVFNSRGAALLDAIGLSPRRMRYREFWALRGIDLELGKGERIGIIGRNGAGKSTLLKLITQNVVPTEGVVNVTGRVQALLEIGGGLHPEFTGRGNIHAALALLGLDDRQISEAEAEIAEFTELGRFLDQPFKTYSLGMQGRLAFAVATTIEPEILIVDEVLGAGDAYFFNRSTARMRQLIESGASVLLVSHDLNQIVRFCDETIWIDRGQIVAQGPTLEVVKAYEKFVREIEEKRLEAKNRKLRLGTFDSFERENFVDFLSVKIQSGGPCDLRLVRLVRNGDVEDGVAIGSPQDVNDAQSAYLVPNEDAWTPPHEADGHFHRTLMPNDGAGGELVFKLWFFYADSKYQLDLEYRSPQTVRLEITHGASESQVAELPAAPDWSTHSALIAVPSEGPAVSRWSGVEGPRIDEIRVVGAEGRERTIFETQRDLSVIVVISAGAPGKYRLIPAALIFRLDGLVATRHVGDETLLEIGPGEAVEARLDYGPLLLGDGTYQLSVGLYRQLDLNNPAQSEYYDYFDRSFEFQVVGNPPLHNELVRHPGTWRIEQTTARSANAPVVSAKQN